MSETSLTLRNHSKQHAERRLQKLDRSLAGVRYRQLERKRQNQEVLSFSFGLVVMIAALIAALKILFGWLPISEAILIPFIVCSGLLIVCLLIASVVLPFSFFHTSWIVLGYGKDIVVKQRLLRIHGRVQERSLLRGGVDLYLEDEKKGALSSREDNVGALSAVSGRDET